MRLPEPVAPVLWPRRVFHLIAGSTLPLGILFLPLDTAQWLLIGGSLGAAALEVLRGLVGSVNDWFVRRVPLFKAAERTRITGATFMWLAATFLVFVSEKEIAVLAMLFLSVGDPFAALIGVRDHRTRRFGKSLAGTAAFTVTALGAGLLVSLHPDVPLAWWLAPGAVMAALVELAPVPLDDNLTVPIASATAMALLAMV
ncbi:MAG: hypothetical protein OXL97_04805 [Chloroflexota bacterium]|nr:hypothetical protein [Chloroflexota bacterium]MDE2884750.1 hypothetical protein [Chloroflexota bacterium]